MSMRRKEVPHIIIHNPVRQRGHRLFVSVMMMKMRRKHASAISNLLFPLFVIIKKKDYIHEKVTIMDIKKFAISLNDFYILIDDTYIIAYSP